MAKLETPEKLAIRKAQESRELEKRRLQMQKKRPKGYLLYLLVVISIVYIVDEITSAMGGSLQSEVVTDFFVEGMGMEYNTGLAAFTAMGAPVYSVMALMPFYKSLADRYGRKLFLVLNTIGMGIGMGICMVANGPIVYILGMLVINFVMYNDMQVIYIMECAPEKHRAKFASLTKAVALMGVTLIPVLRDMFMGDDGSQWRKVFMIPAVVAVIVGVAAIFLMGETPAFVAKRVAYLELTDEERAAREAVSKKEADESKGTHTAKRGVDTHTRLVGNLLKAHTLIVAQHHHLALLGGQKLHQTTHVAFNLLGYHLILHIMLGITQSTQHIVATIGLTHRARTLLAAEVVDNLIVGNTQQPREKLTHIGIAAFVDNTDSLDECLLQYIISHIGVLNHHTDIVADTTRVTFNKL